VENRTKAEDEIKTGEQHESLKQTVWAAGTSPDPICRSLTVAWRAGPTVRIRFPPAASPVRTRVFEANPIDGQRMISPWSNPIANFDLRWTTYDIINIGQCRRGDCSMSSVRDWTTGFAVIGTILLGPIIAFLTVVAAEVLIDFLKERAVIAAIAVCAVVAGMIGWVLLWLLFRRMSPYRVFLWVFFRRLTNTSD
jgi:hypothetical protein